MNKNLLPNFIIVLVLLLLVQYTTMSFLSPTAASLVTATLGFALAVYGGKKDIEDSRLLGQIRNALYQVFRHYTLSVLMAGVYLLVNTLVLGFDSALADMESQKLISFKEGMHGREHLLIYQYGFASAPLLFILLTWYGTRLGQTNCSFTYGQLTVSLFIAIVFSKLLLFIAGLDSHNTVAVANPQLPMGTLPLEIVLRASAYLMQSVVCALYVWIVAKLTASYIKPKPTRADGVNPVVQPDEIHSK